MIYCPSCKKPSAKKNGQCPHCGVELTSGVAPKRAAKAPQKKPSLSKFNGGDVNLDFNHNNDAPLELETQLSDAPSPVFQAQEAAPVKPPNVESNEQPQSAVSHHQVQRPVPQRMATDSQAEQLAQFGTCEGGIIGTIKYGLHVKKRLAFLTEQTDAAKLKKEAEWENLEISKADLGRAAHFEKLDDTVIHRLMQKAIKQDSKIEELNREKKKINEEFEKQLGVIDKNINEIETILNPLKSEELKSQTEFDKLSKEKARRLAKIKRTEIELRNLRELITKRQADYSDLEKTKEERQRLLSEISSLDKKQPPLLNRLEVEKEEFATIEGPFEFTENQLREIREKIAAQNEKIVSLQTDKKTVQNTQNDALRAINNKAQGESKHAQEAWAQVGERVYVNQLFKDSQTMTQIAQEIKTQTSVFFDAQNQLELHEQALTCYDKEAFEQSKKYLLGAAILGGILLIILLSLIVF